MKLTDLPGFWRAIESWRLIHAPFRQVTWLAVPVAEVALGASWFLGLWRRRVLAAAGAMLVLFTLAYLWHALAAEPPDCGCFGVLLRYDRWLGETWGVVARNVCLLLILGSGAGLNWAHLAPSPRADRPEGEP